MKTVLNNNQLIAHINHKGAELISLKNSAQREFIWEGNPEFWGKHSPVLFPIVGTLKENQYRYKNTTYQMPRHGFARDHEFVLISKTETSALFALRATPETKAVYPFQFELHIRYTLEKNSLVVCYTIINQTNETMPFSIGAHPAFAMPQAFENYSLLFEKHEELNSHLLQNDLLSEHIKSIPTHNRRLSLDYMLFENDALIFKELNSKTITILENENPILGIHFKDFKHFGIWTKPGAPFLCLEPWLGYSDTGNSDGNLMHKEAIQFVGPQKESAYAFSIEIL